MLNSQEIERRYDTESEYGKVWIIKIRKILVDYICDLGESLHLSTGTIHLSVYYMDLLLTKDQSEKSKFQLISMVSLILAS